VLVLFQGAIKLLYRKYSINRYLRQGAKVLVHA